MYGQGPSDFNPYDGERVLGALLASMGESTETPPLPALMQISPVSISPPPYPSSDTSSQNWTQAGGALGGGLGKLPWGQWFGSQGQTYPGASGELDSAIGNWNVSSGVGTYSAPPATGGY